MLIRTSSSSDWFSWSRDNEVSGTHKQFDRLLRRLVFLLLCALSATTVHFKSAVPSEHVSKHVYLQSAK